MAGLSFSILRMGAHARPGQAGALAAAVVLLALALVLPLPGHGVSEEEPLDLKAIFQKGIPVSPFAAAIYGYADAMLEHGRGAGGPRSTGLFLSALDRTTLAPLVARPPCPAGVIEAERPGGAGGPLVASNVLDDENLLRLLFFLKGLSSQERYPRAAEESLRWFLGNAASRETGLLPWGRFLSWSFEGHASGDATSAINDPAGEAPGPQAPGGGRAASGLAEPTHELSRPWLLWDRCFEIDAVASQRFARALWTCHAADSRAGILDARVHLHRPSPRPGRESARHMGFSIRTWAEAYAHAGDASFLEAIDAVLRRHEAVSPEADPWNGSRKGQDPAGFLSLAVDLDGAARKVPEPLRSRLARAAEREDGFFSALPHDLAGRKGFVAGEQAGSKEISYTPLWDPSRGGSTTARVAMICVSRYENTGRPAHREHMVRAADAYLDSLPEDGVDAWPGTFGQAISLQLAAFRATSREAYFRRAFRLGEIAMERFFGGSPLPRASLKTDHYEAATGAGTLVLALVDLHLTLLHITAVRAPVNTIDR